jgi:two-component system, cell cycle response regulator DivK
MGKARILVIEDNEDNLGLVRFLLEESGYEVRGAPDGRVGLEKAYEMKPDLILLDMGLPEVDGWQVVQQLKADPSSKDMLVVALTAHALPGDRKKAIDAGCDGYISKPLDVPNFTKMVATYLRKRRLFSQTGSLTL